MTDPGGKDGKKHPVEVSGGFDREPKVHFKPFPAVRDADTPLPVSFSKTAYADLLAHAKENLDVEVCGVLVGQFCEDDGGEHVSVEAVIRGQAAKQSGTHVTFTQETWNHIHERMEADHRRKEIVGWYHTHPGFGVQFSEMDLFIQNNFFSGHNQIAYLIDPLSNEESLCLTRSGAAVMLPCFWVDGRRRTCRIPTAAPVVNTGTNPTPASPQMEQTLKAFESRLHQTLQAIEKQRNSLYQMLVTLGLMAGCGIILVVAYSLYRQYTSDYRPPESVRFAEIPVRIGDDVYFVGVDAVRWKAPKDMADALIESVKRTLIEEQARREAEEAGKAAAEKKTSESSSDTK